MRYLSQKDYPEVLGFLQRFKWEQRKSEPPSEERKRLGRQAHAKAANIGWSHDQLSQKCREWYGSSFGNLSIHLLRDLVKKLSKIEEQQI